MWTRRFWCRAVNSRSSSAKITSAIDRTLKIKSIFPGQDRSVRSRRMDMTGVMPTPPATNNTASADAGSNVKRPEGAETVTVCPVMSLSCRY
jgi:hypothetical protein